MAVKSCQCSCSSSHALPAKTPITGIIITLSVVALSLDGLDGYLARRQRLTSRFGAAFDNGDEILLTANEPLGQLHTGQAIEVGTDIGNQCLLTGMFFLIEVAQGMVKTVGDTGGSSRNFFLQKVT